MTNDSWLLFFFSITIHSTFTLMTLFLSFSYKSFLSYRYDSFSLFLLWSLKTPFLFLLYHSFLLYSHDLFPSFSAAKDFLSHSYEFLTFIFHHSFLLHEACFLSSFSAKISFFTHSYEFILLSFMNVYHSLTLSNVLYLNILWVVFISNNKESY